MMAIGGVMEKHAHMCASAGHVMPRAANGGHECAPVRRDEEGFKCGMHARILHHRAHSDCLYMCATCSTVQRTRRQKGQHVTSIVARSCWAIGSTMMRDICVPTTGLAAMRGVFAARALYTQGLWQHTRKARHRRCAGCTRQCKLQTRHAHRELSSSARPSGCANISHNRRCSTDRRPKRPTWNHAAPFRVHWQNHAFQQAHPMTTGARSTFRGLREAMVLSPVNPPGHPIEDASAATLPHPASLCNPSSPPGPPDRDKPSHIFVQLLPASPVCALSQCRDATSDRASERAGEVCTEALKHRALSTDTTSAPSTAS